MPLPTENPTRSCAGKHGACTANEDCCSLNCNVRGRKCKGARRGLRSNIFDPPHASPDNEPAGQSNGRNSRVPFNNKGNPPGLSRAAVALEREKNRMRWKGRQNYSFTLDINPIADTSPDSGPVRVSVKKGQVSKVVNIGTGTPVNSEVQYNTQTIEGLFDTIAKQADADIENIVVEYDETTGSPKKIIVAYLPLGIKGQERITMIYVTDVSVSN